MKTIDEYTAEVFRRSEIKVKRRRKAIKKTVLCLIPVIICFSFAVFASLPLIQPAKSSEPEMGLADNQESAEISYSSLEIIKNGFTESIAGKEKTDRAFSIIEGMFGSDALAGESFVSSGAGGQTEDEIVFVFTNKETGAEEKYTLQGSILTRESDGAKTTISADEKQELESVCVNLKEEQT